MRGYQPRYLERIRGAAAAPRPEGCMLSDEAQGCEGPLSCAHCGWNSAEFAHRQAILYTDGLAKCADGLERLILPYLADSGK